jgi:peptidoglycan/xylan/chitin deacetylase (PgdA/CDA1 family)
MIFLLVIAVSFFSITGFGFSAKTASPWELAQKYPDYAKVSGPAGKRQVAITFDDGPDGLYTPKILDVLKENQAKATFFLIGTHAEANPEMVKRIVNEGHEIGNHSYDHSSLPDVAISKFQNEILDTKKILKQISGYDPLFFRPPFTRITDEQVKWLADQKISTILWNTDTQDWKQLPADLIETKVFDQVKPGSIIIMHSAYPDGDSLNLSGTIAALPQIIKKLRAQGLEPVTISELLGTPAYSDERKVPEIQLDSTEYSIVVQENLDTSVTVINGMKRVTGLCTFSVDDPSVVTVDFFGNIKGIKRGKALLTATYNGSKTTAKIYVY